MSSLAPVWVTARAAGIGALLASSLSLSLGLVSALRLPALKRRGIELRAAHEALALATMALIAVHGVALLFDPVLRAGVAEIVAPFLSPYRPVAVALGQISAYGMVALGLTYYARNRIGVARWRNAHRFVSVFWVLAVVHGVTAGTDATTWWFATAIGLPAAAGGALLAGRLGRSARAGHRPAASPGS